MDFSQIKPQKYSATITVKEQLSSKVFLFQIKLVEPQTFTFIPGQFINVSVSDTLTRQYSIASSPRNENGFELVVDIAPGGPGSKFFESKQAGDTISFVGPMGKFLLIQNDSPVVFLASGTGIAPFKAMIDFELEKSEEISLEQKRKLFLYLGFRYASDMFWDNYFKDLSAKYTNFSYELTLSQPESTWTGKKGYVQNWIDEGLLTNQNTQYYICGGQRMVTGALEFLREKHIVEDCIHFEPF